MAHKKRRKSTLGRTARRSIYRYPAYTPQRQFHKFANRLPGVGQVLKTTRAARLAKSLTKEAFYASRLHKTVGGAMLLRSNPVARKRERERMANYAKHGVRYTNRQIREVCKTRRTRRKALFATRKAGRGARGPLNKRITRNSRIKC